MNYLQRSRKVLREVKVCYRPLAVRSIASDFRASPLDCFFDLCDLGIKRLFVIVVKVEPLFEIRVAGRGVNGDFVFHYDAHSALIACRTWSVERAPESSLVRTIKSGKSTVLRKRVRGIAPRAPGGDESRGHFVKTPLGDVTCHVVAAEWTDIALRTGDGPSAVVV